DHERTNRDRTSKRFIIVSSRLRLEAQAGSKLHSASRVGARNYAGTASVDGAAWQPEIGMVEQVRSFHLELQLCLLTKLWDGKILEQCSIDVDIAWTVQDVPSGIAEGIVGRYHKCTRVKPFINIRVRNRSFSDAVRTPGSRQRTTFVGAADIRRKGTARVYLEQRRDFPSAHNLVQQAVLALKTLAAPKGKFVDQAPVEEMAEIRRRRAVVRSRIVLVLQSPAILRTPSATTDEAGVRDLVHGLRPGVIGRQQQPVRHLLLHTGLERVVVGDPVEERSADPQILGIRLILTIVWPQFALGHLVDIPRIRKMNAPIPYICGLQHNAAFELVLDAELIFLGVAQRTVKQRIVNNLAVQDVWRPHLRTGIDRRRRALG